MQLTRSLGRTDILFRLPKPGGILNSLASETVLVCSSIIALYIATWNCVSEMAAGGWEGFYRIQVDGVG
jgi:hypothetical protein